MSLYNFTINKGATLQFTVNYTDTSGTAVSLAGYEAAMNIKTDYEVNSGTSILILTSSLGDSYSTNQNVTSSAFLSLSGSYPFNTHITSCSIGVYAGYAATGVLTPGEYVYDLELTNTTTYERVRLLQGKVKVSKTVTTAEPV